MVLRRKSYGFEAQELWFREERAMVSRCKSYGFEAQELTGHELTGEFFRNYSWGKWVGIAHTLYIIRGCVKIEEGVHL